MHIGGVRTALYAWLWARKNGGTFILRIEDTDQKREVAGSLTHIMESLEWLGLDWDYGPDKRGPFGSCIQSERMELYRAAAQILIDKGLAYPDPYTPEELDAMRKEAENAKRPFLFREHRPETFGVWDASRPLRFKVPVVKKYHWHDEVRGELTAGEEAVDDFILIKADGYPTYNFAHIIDDHAMGVTHIFRGDEFISSTPRFLSLYDALGITWPKFVTLPPILRDDKTKKLGKRDGAKDILEYRAEGYLPEAMRNFLALIGWNPGTEQEIFSQDELLQAFDTGKIHTHGGVFNEEKLRWFNREYLLRMREDDFLDEALRRLEEGVGGRGLPWDENVAHRILPIVKERISVWHDLHEELARGDLDFFFRTPEVSAGSLPERKSNAEEAKKHLAHVHAALAALPDFTTESIRASVWDYATENGRGAVLWPFRYALTGMERSPDPFVVAYAIGKEETLKRVKTAIDLLSSP
jgi:glutamyl-tRNA synthetase